MNDKSKKIDESKTDDSKTLNFYKLMKLLEQKIVDNLLTLDVNQTTLIKKNQKNAKLKKIISWFPSIFYLTLFLVTVLGGFIGGGIFIKESYLLHHNLTITNGVLTPGLEFVTFFLGAMGLATFGGLEYVALKVHKNSYEIYEFANHISDQFEKKLYKKQKKREKNIKINDYHIQQAEEFLDELKSANDCYDYMIYSSLKMKRFSQQDVDTIYELLPYHKISTLIYLLYHDKLDEFKKMNINDQNSYEQKLNIEEKIQNVKDYLAKVIAERKQNDNRVVHLRSNRMARFHNMSTYDKILQTYESTQSSSDEEIKTVTRR